MTETEGWQFQHEKKEEHTIISLYTPAYQTLATATEYIIKRKSFKKTLFGQKTHLESITGVVFFPGLPAEEKQKSLLKSLQIYPQPEVYYYNGKRYGGIEGLLVIIRKDNPTPEEIYDFCHDIESLRLHCEFSLGQEPLEGAITKDTFLFDFITDPNKTTQIAGYPLAHLITAKRLAKPIPFPKLIPSLPPPDLLKEMGTKKNPYKVAAPDEIILGKRVIPTILPDGKTKWESAEDFVKYSTNLFSGGVKVTAKTGGGKSLLVKTLAYQFAINGIPVVIIDPKVGGEWVGLTSPVPDKYIHIATGKEVSSAEELEKYKWPYPKMGLDNKYFYNDKYKQLIKTEVAIFTIKSRIGVIWASHPLNYTITAERARDTPERAKAVVTETLIKHIATVLSDYYKIRSRGSGAVAEKAEEFRERIAAPIVDKMWKDGIIKQINDFTYQINTTFKTLNQYLGKVLSFKETGNLVKLMDPQWLKVRKNFIMKSLIEKEEDVLSGISSKGAPVEELIKSPVFDGKNAPVRISIITGRDITSEDIHLTTKNIVDNLYAVMASKKRKSKMGGDVGLVIIFDETSKVAPGPVMKAERAEPTSQSVLKSVMRLVNESRAIKIVPILLAQRDEMIDKTVREGRAINIHQKSLRKGRMSVINPVTEDEEFFEVPSLITDHTPVGTYDDMTPYIKRSKTTLNLKDKYNK